jgi:hypothetical protein
MEELLNDLNEVMAESPDPVVDLTEEQPEVLPESDVESTDSSESEEPSQIIVQNDFPDYIIDLGDGLYELTDSIPVSPMSVNGVYPGTMQSTASNYFAGVVANNPGVDYVAFRDGQYSSVLFYGQGLEYSSGRFTGSASFVRYNSNGGYNDYTITRGTDSLNISDDGFIYTNLDKSFAAFPEGEVISFGAVVPFALCVCIGLWILGRIFFRNR